MSSIVLSVMLVVANVMGAGMIVPQVTRLHRRKTSDGVSAAWIGVGLAMNLWWVGYGLASELWGLIPVSVVAFVLYSVMAVQFARLNGVASLGRGALGAVAIGSIPLPALIVSGWSTAGVVVGLVYAVQFAPAAFTAVRSDVLDGLSPVTWAMAGLEAAIWLAYGLHQGDAALMVGGGGGLVMSLLILARLTQHGRSRRALELADELTLAR